MVWWLCTVKSGMSMPRAVARASSLMSKLSRPTPMARRISGW